MTTATVANDARGLLSDEHAPYRWPDPRVLRYLVNGRREILIRHPEALYGDDIITETPTEPTEIGDTPAICTVGINDSYRMALAQYIAHYCLMEDSEDGNNLKKAATHWEMFVKLMS